MPDHIDPFAPADSPQHPGNWTPASGEKEPEQAPFHLHLTQEALSLEPDERAAQLAERDSEYAHLIELFGTEDEQQAWHDGPPYDWERMASLQELRDREKEGAAEAPAEDQGDTPADEKPARKRSTGKADPRAKLEEALARLDQE